MNFEKYACVCLLAAFALCTNVAGRLWGEGIMTSSAHMPRNPQRPMRATNCKQALQRLREAKAGSPIIDKAQNKEHLMKARAQAERLCSGKEQRRRNDTKK